MSRPGMLSPTPAKSRRTAGTCILNNKASHETSKTRRKMAAKSNRINRLRCKGWKH
jgi:hypothetical protein